ncbi:caspase family protein [Fuerstiella marisgermanici]|uniref:Caspase domain protein n=1 Tax=Fuerstiella marisgermanici TaxID=1891926 RepID=A0A1P8WGQ7_9PLAN|nr:caspase family protein [Fuerstiella marisgermanici]APZ93234.1 Caspase domain protein [Fuerstiella marisgermanici]
MKTCITSFLCIGLVGSTLLLETAVGDEPEELASARRSGNLRVLLVGVSRYPSLDKRQHLKGPPNDVHLIDALLSRKFADRIVSQQILTADKAPNMQPTRSNIEREFTTLIEEAQPDDQIFIMMAGHGSQQPDDAADPDETDGKDEIFLPQDIGKWKKESSTVENAISDDVIRGWLTEIRKKGAFVFFVADSCHSGTIARGDSAVSRDVDPTELGVPAAVEHDSEGDSDIKETIVEPQAAGVVALYAAHSHELAYEAPIPKATSKKHGWLSWALCESLENSSGKLSYADLARKIQWVYEQNGWTSSHPLIEGTDLDIEVLGTTDLSKPARPRLDSRDTPWTISGGLLQGITEDSVLAVIDDRQRTVGHVRVTQEGSVASEVEAVEFEGSPKVDAIASGLECAIVRRDLGLPDLRVAINTSRCSSYSDAIRRSLADRIAGMKLGDAPVAVDLVANRADAQILIVCGDDQLLLASIADVELDLTADTAGVDDAVSPRDGAQWMQTTPAGLSDDLRRIIAALNLRAMAGSNSGTDSRTVPQIAIEIGTKVKRRVSRTETKTLTEAKELRNQDKVSITLKNAGLIPADVTVLYVSSDWSIKSFFPDPRSPGTHNRLMPNERPIALPEIKIDDSTIGLEDLIVIAVHSDSVQPVNFAFLEQVGLPVAQRRGHGRDLASRGPKEPPHPLDALLKGRMSGASRGAVTSKLGQYAIQRHSWTVTK